VALVLPGGRADSLDPTAARQLAGLRMLPFAANLHRGGGRDGLAVWTLRYRVRGWNGVQASPLADVSWALDEVRRRHDDVSVVLVGHSMGGRAAMRAAGDSSVVAAVGLAPWLPDGEPVEQLAGRRILLAHGDNDRVTSADASRRYAGRAAAAASDIAFVSIRREHHAMLLRARAWQRLTTAYVLDVLGLSPMPPDLRGAVQRGWL
jgi:dienelactone hydrolase